MLVRFPYDIAIVGFVAQRQKSSALQQRCAVADPLLDPSPSSRLGHQVDSALGLTLLRRRSVLLDDPCRAFDRALTAFGMRIHVRETPV